MNNHYLSVLSPGMYHCMCIHVCVCVLVLLPLMSVHTYDAQKQFRIESLVLLVALISIRI